MIHTPLIGAIFNQGARIKFNNLRGGSLIGQQSLCGLKDVMFVLPWASFSEVSSSLLAMPMPSRSCCPVAQTFNSKTNK